MCYITNVVDIYVYIYVYRLLYIYVLDVIIYYSNNSKYSYTLHNQMYVFTLIPVFRNIL